MSYLTYVVSNSSYYLYRLKDYVIFLKQREINENNSNQ